MKKILNYVLAGVLAVVLAAPLYSQPVTTTVSTQSVTLTSAQIDALATTPVQIVAAPGTGKMLVPLSATFHYKFGTTPYTPAAQTQPVLGVVYGNTVPSYDVAFGGSQVGFLDQSVNRIMVGGEGTFFVGAAVVDDQTEIANQGLYVSASGNPSGGDGTIVVIVSFITISIN